MGWERKYIPDRDWEWMRIVEQPRELTPLSASISPSPVPIPFPCPFPSPLPSPSLPSSALPPPLLLYAS
ncbi:hypothetical protein PLICRDRAFT_46664 [Plicaturopsis crispa FD-325 SS-3]|uniref:Uncharacterized protein n=1 Tax=Plicaturopsis crispa FD-325 SS-3 TaxID=944288 RepID=A0A0C9T6Y5_PLICR|nr:hypothetical protein PLICRDRAFT_46664 [Plicaturopsis crispa FD-325 SS-3]